MSSQENDNILENHTIREMIARVDERTKMIVTRMDQITNNFVTKEQFNPIQKIVYGFVSLVLIAVVGAMIALVVRK